ncbi:hypothetical protein DSL72_005464 [Monilinia vaccinii-corymbosi]|uniref:Methyltransferase type 11 domain-containing protein n=1 Tax=Monilinia vaccinii-corymbosi TaxID=61207 RepID=A0A8A3PFN1_9HELO|nr:hypothetical protein DSL72_005464 [Monilinia vaccinii-corymbosi]
MLVQVIAIDIYPFQPETVPENLYLQVDDLNNRFTFQAHNFDLVHSRLMAAAIHANRWAGYLQDMLRVVRPGGWCQLVELYHNAQSDNGRLTNDHALRQWSSSYVQSLNGLKDLRIALRLPAMMRAAGFVEIEYRMIPLHTCGVSFRFHNVKNLDTMGQFPNQHVLTSRLGNNDLFHVERLVHVVKRSVNSDCAEKHTSNSLTDPREHDIGTANRENVQQFLGSIAVYPFTERLGMSIQDVQLLVAQARREADDPALKVKANPER